MNIVYSKIASSIENGNIIFTSSIFFNFFV